MSEKYLFPHLARNMMGTPQHTQKAVVTDLPDHKQNNPQKETAEQTAGERTACGLFSSPATQVILVFDSIIFKSTLQFYFLCFPLQSYCSLQAPAHHNLHCYYFHYRISSQT